MSRTADEYLEGVMQESQDDGERSLAEQIDFQHYLRILRKHKWPIAMFTAMVTGLAGYYATTATPIYEATSVLLIENQKSNAVSIESLVGLDGESKTYYQTQYALLKSRRLAERVVDRLQLWDEDATAANATADDTGAVKGANGEKLAPESITDKVKGMLSSAGIIEGSEQNNAGVTLDLGNPAANGGDPVASSQSTELYEITVDKPASEDEIPDFSMALTDDEGYRAPQTEAELRRAQVVSRFMSNLTITPVRNTTLVNVSYESPDPVHAAHVANTVSQEYIQSYLDARVELTTSASEWLNQRLATLKADLDQAEDRLIKFKQENGLVDVGGSVDRLNEQELLLATSELATARSELATASDLYREVQALRDQPELLQSIVAIQTDPLVRQVKLELGQRQRELDELLNRYGQRHPRVVDAQSRLASLNTTMEGHVNRVIGSIEKDYQLIRQRVASIEAKLAAGKEEIQDLGTKRFELEALSREVDTKRDIYDTFFSRITETNSTEGLEEANARISDYALPPTSPVKPKKQLIIALAALGSLILSMLMAILYEQMDSSVKSANDIEEKLGLKLLGILPLIKAGLLKRTVELPLNPAEINDVKGTFHESVNTVRTTLCLGEDDKTRRQVITITSSIPSEGKSTASLNLAYSLAQLERVLVIDCDMRRPSVAKAAGFDKNIPGLTSLLTGTATAKECIKRGVFDGVVDILPSGPLPEQPLELLSSLRFEKILEQLRKHYDRIVIDSAPTQAVSDALVLGKLSDAVIYVIKSHSTEFELVKRGIKRLNDAKAPVFGCVVTQVDIQKMVSYGGDYYYQGYYDYYGYAETGPDATAPGRKIRLTNEEITRLKTDDSNVELDLDYGYETAAARANQSRNAEAEFDGVESEFDLTADLSSLPPSDRDQNQRHASRRTRGDAGDDLEIL